MHLIKKLKELFTVSDLLLAGTLISIITIMIIPLPVFALDLLMVTNISLAVMCLLVAMYLTQPLDFAAFPSILLVITLFRLSLNVASTKLILSLGPDFNGQVVQAFI